MNTKNINSNLVFWISSTLCILTGLTMTIYRLVYVTKNNENFENQGGEDKNKLVTVGSILTIIGVAVLALTQKHHIFKINDTSGFIIKALSTPNILGLLAGISLVAHILLSNNLFSAAKVYNNESIFGPNMPVLIFYSLYCFIIAFFLLRFPTTQEESTLSKILSILNK